MFDDIGQLLTTMTILAKRRSITYIILFILLGMRFSTSIAYLLNHSLISTGTIPSWTQLFEKWSYLTFLLGSFPLIAIVIILNRADLGSLNIDRLFVFIFLCSGLPIILESYALSWMVAILPVIAAISIIYGFWRNRFRFGNTRQNLGPIYLLIVGIFVACFVVVSGFLNIPRIAHTILFFFSDAVPNSVYEEVIFRGLLWTFLKNLKWTEPRIFFFQAFLFWISHLDRLSLDP